MAHASAPSAPPYTDASRDFHEDGASAIQEEAIFSDVLVAQLQEGERFEDCFDADFIEEQRLLLSRYGDMKQRVGTPANGDRHEASVGMHEAQVLRNRSWQSEGEVCSTAFNRTQRSLPILFPSDLPVTLDGVVQAVAAAEDDDGARSGCTSSSTQRSLPPTLSNVQKALHDMHSGAEDHGQSFRGYSDAAPSFSQARRHAAVPLNPPARTASYDEFVSKFAQHFKLDCN